MAPDPARHYSGGPDEGTRLRRTAHGGPEFLRTRELLRKHLAGCWT